MNDRRCDYCGRMLPPEAVRECPDCGAAVAPPNVERRDEFPSPEELAAQQAEAMRMLNAFQREHGGLFGRLFGVAFGLPFVMFAIFFLFVLISMFTG